MFQKVGFEFNFALRLFEVNNSRAECFTHNGFVGGSNPPWPSVFLDEKCCKRIPIWAA